MAGKRQRRFTAQDIAQAMGRSQDEVTELLEKQQLEAAAVAGAAAAPTAGAADMSGSDVDDDDRDDFADGHYPKKERVEVVSAQVGYLTKVVKHLGKEAYRNSVRIEGKGVRMKDFHLHNRLVIPELCKDANVVQVKVGPYSIDISYKNFASPKNVIDSLKRTLARVENGDKYIILPPFDPMTNELKAPANYAYKMIRNLYVANKSDDNISGPEFKLRTIRPCAESVRPQWSLQNPKGETIIGGICNFNTMICEIFVRKSFEAGGVRVEGKELGQVMSQGWGRACEFTCLIRIVDKVTPAPTFKEVIEARKAK